MKEKKYIIPKIDVIILNKDEIITTSAPESTKEDPYGKDIY